MSIANVRTVLATLVACAVPAVAAALAPGAPPAPAPSGHETTLEVLLVLGAATAFAARRSVVRARDARRAGEAAVRAAEGRFHSLFDQAFQSTWLLSPAGEVVEANATALAVVGGDRAALVGRRFWDLPIWSERGRVRVRQGIESVARGAFVRLEEDVLTTGGERAVFDMSFKPMRDAAGGIVMVIHEARDVTERKAAEAALRVSEAKFAGILSIAADAIITVDEAHCVVHFNRGAEEIFGYAAAEMFGQPLDRLLPEHALDAHREHVTRFAESEDAARRMGARREVSGRRRSGEAFPAEASISKLESDGRILFTVVLRDVTDRRRAEDRQRFLADAGAALAASVDHPRTLAEVARLALPTLGDACIVDIDGEGGLRELAVAHVDPAKEAALREMRRRYPPPTGGGHPLAVVRRTREPLLVSVTDDTLLANTLIADTTLADTTHVDTTLDAEHARIVRGLDIRSAMFAPLTVRDRLLGVVSYYSASPRAYTADDLALAAEVARRAALAIDNARLYEEARRASAARDEVLAIVSHDLRNPLSTVGMCSTALMHPAPIPPDEAREIAGTIHKAAAWMQRIIRDLLDVTSIEGGRLALDREAVGVEPLLRTAEGMMQAQARNAGIELAVREPGPLPDVEADAERVLQVLLNLMGNAVKFTGTGGRVTIGAYAVDASGAGSSGTGSSGGRPGWVRFDVADTGAGIAPEQLARVFDRYWQARARGRAGVGLGLAIARGIVEAHGGAIDVESAVGVGTTFSFTVPAVRGGAARDDLARDDVAPDSAYASSDFASSPASRPNRT